MLSDVPVKRPLVTSWEATSIRIAAFPTELGLVAQAPAWFEALAGTAPEDETVSRQRGVHNASGPFLEATLAVEASVDRFQIKLSPATQQEVPPKLGPTVRVACAFLDAVLPFFENDPCPPLVRVGFATESILSVPDSRTAYDYLAALLPTVEFDPTTARDLFFRVNRPRTASTGLKTNRLCTWYARKYVAVPITPVAQRAFSQTADEAASFALSVDIDVNSTGDNTDQIARPDIVPLIREYATMTEQILEHGDIP